MATRKVVCVRDQLLQYCTVYVAALCSHIVAWYFDILCSTLAIYIVIQLTLRSDSIPLFRLPRVVYARDVYIFLYILALLHTRIYPCTMRIDQPFSEIGKVMYNTAKIYVSTTLLMMLFTLSCHREGVGL